MNCFCIYHNNTTVLNSYSGITMFLNMSHGNMFFEDFPCFWTYTIEIPCFSNIYHGNTMFLNIFHANTIFLDMHNSITMFLGLLCLKFHVFLYLQWKYNVFKRFTC